MELTGIHHITLVVADAARSQAFYTQVLGLRLIKQTVDFDQRITWHRYPGDPGDTPGPLIFDQPPNWHLTFGDAAGSPGTLVTVLAWPVAVRGQRGIGGTHHFALLAETTNAQLKWKRWLTDQGIAVQGPYDRTYFRSIYFRDPDGCLVEIATRWPGMAEDEPDDALGTTLITPPEELTKGHRDEAAIAAQTWPEPIPALGPDMTLGGLHHISALSSDIGRTTAFWTELLGFRLVKQTISYDDPAVPHYYYGLGDGAPGTLITYFAYPPDQMRPARLGPGLTHHFALTVETDDALEEWHTHLRAAGVDVTPVRDQRYFRSFYFRDPDGQGLEIATRAPGFLVDETDAELGQHLALPPWLEAERATIAGALPPLTP